MPKVIWEQATSPPLPHTTPNHSSYGSCTFAQLCCKLPSGYNGTPTFATKITPYRGLIPKPNHLLHPWTHLPYHPKPYLYPIIHFAKVN